MSEKRPNDRYRHRNAVNINNKEPEPSFLEKLLGDIKRLLKDIGAFFGRAFKKYDAFVRRIFKLGPPPKRAQKNSMRNDEYTNEPVEQMRTFTRDRRSRINTDFNDEEPSQFDEDSTMRFERVPDYLQEKTYASPAPLADLEPDNHTHEKHEHRLGHIFKKRQKPRSFFTSVLMSLLKILIALMLIGASSGLGVIQGIANAYVDTTPELDLTKIENLDETSFIYDGNGNLVTSFVGLENRISASVDELPALLMSAFVAVEDERFYTHNGIDIKRIAGAFFSNLRTDTTQGGSTITQQLIKLKILSSEQTYKRKLQEAYLAIQLEEKYDKDEILASYMNTINLGSGNYGVKAAARDYFGKELNELSIRECAMLAGIANSSYWFNPRTNYYSRNTPERTDDRTNLVLRRMYKNGYISQSDYEAAINEQVFIIESSPKQKMYDMPYFLEYAIDDVVAHFIRQRNLENNATNRNMIESELRTSGYHIYTTVDPTIQQTVENSLYNWDKYPKTSYESDSSVLVQNQDGSYQELVQPQAAAVVYDYHTGQLKAIVGGRQQPQVKKALNRAVDSYLPVGSSIKPLAVYGPALEKGMSPASIVLDLPLPIEGWNTDEGYPDNYGGTFSGVITMREALYRSVNNAAANILLNFVNLDDSYGTIEALGIDTKSVNKDGSGLALGTSGIRVLDMAVAYGAIGNAGTYIEPIAFTKVVDSNGNVLLDATASNMQTKRQVFKESTSWMLVDMMEDVVTRGTGRNARIDGMTVAGKTGTNGGYKGVYFSGITPYYTAAIWIGHDSNKPLAKNSTGGGSAAPLWQDFMSKIHETYDLSDRPIISDDPASFGLVRVKTCPVSGKLITDACLHDGAGLEPVVDWMLPENVPTEECDMHYEGRICLESGKLETQFCHFGSQTDPYSYIRIPQDHPANQLTDEEFAEYFPNALRGLPDDMSLFNPNNPDYAHMFCPIHTQQWYDNKVLIDDALLQAQNLIDQTEILLVNYNSYIDDEIKGLANGAINDLKAAMDTFNLANITTAHSKLQALKTDYLDPIVAGVPTASPTPPLEPSPSPTPTASAEPTPTASAEPTPTPTT